MKSFNYTPILGWSISRYDTFTTCRRRYYYHYYYKWDTEYPPELIAHLRSMVSVPLQIGTVTHTCISTLLMRLLKEPDQPVDVQRFSDYARRKAVEQHRKANYSEIYYSQKTRIDTEEIVTNVLTAVTNLIISDCFQWLAQQASAATAPWIIDPEGFGETRVEGLKAYCKVDFLIPAQEYLYILDWKTGKEQEEKHSIQMRGYAAWASYHFDIQLDNITPTVAYLLPDYHETTVKLNEYDIQDFATLVHEQTHEMYAFCSDLSENVPLPKDRFSQTRIESICDCCNFRQLCERTQIGTHRPG